MNRKEEVRHLLSLSIEELIAESKGQLKLTQTLDELYEYLAEEMVSEFRKAAAGQPGDDYPVTYCRRHPNCIIASDIATAQAPKFNI